MAVIPGTYFGPTAGGNIDVAPFATTDGSEKQVLYRASDGSILMAIDSSGLLEVVAPVAVRASIADIPLRVI